MFKTVPFAGAICIQLIKTSVISSLVDLYMDNPGNSTLNTCADINFSEDGIY